MGEYRLRMLGLQCEKRRPNTARGQNETRPPTGKAEAQPYVDAQTGEPQVRNLADMARRGLLGDRGKGLRILSEIQRGRLPCGSLSRVFR